MAKSLTLDQGILAEAREAAEPRKLSSNHSLLLQLQHDRLAGLLGELDQEAKPIEPRVM